MNTSPLSFSTRDASLMKCGSLKWCIALKENRQSSELFFSRNDSALLFTVVKLSMRWFFRKVFSCLSMFWFVSRHFRCSLPFSSCNSRKSYLPAPQPMSAACILFLFCRFFFMNMTGCGSVVLTSLYCFAMVVKW